MFFIYIDRIEYILLTRQHKTRQDNASLRTQAYSASIYLSPNSPKPPMKYIDGVSRHLLFPYVVHYLV